MGVDATPNLATFAAGDIPTASELDTWHDALDALSSAWVAYTPTLTGITIGNGSITGKYMQLGKLVHFNVAMTWGSTTSWTTPFWSLPVPSADALWVAACLLYDTSSTTNRAPGVCSISSNRLTAYGTDVSGAGNSGGNIDATHPFTWATGDIFRCSGTYEAA